MYLDGILVLTLPTVRVLDDIRKLYIGCNIFNSNCFKGEFKEFRIHRGMLPLSTIQVCYLSQVYDFTNSSVSELVYILFLLNSEPCVCLVAYPIYMQTF